VTTVRCELSQQGAQALPQSGCIVAAAVWPGNAAQLPSLIQCCHTLSDTGLSQILCLSACLSVRVTAASPGGGTAP
jgi:hypothetical protein